MEPLRLLPLNLRSRLHKTRISPFVYPLPRLGLDSPLWGLGPPCGDTPGTDPGGKPGEGPVGGGRYGAREVGGEAYWSHPALWAPRVKMAESASARS